PRTGEPARDAARLPDGTRTVHELVDMDREGLTGGRSHAQIVPFPRLNPADRAPAAEGARPAEIRPARAVDGTEDFRGIPLSERERAVLRLVAEGCANKQIARELMLSERTVKAYLTSTLNKLGVDNRTRAAVLATRWGLL